MDLFCRLGTDIIMVELFCWEGEQLNSVLFRIGCLLEISTHLGMSKLMIRLSGLVASDKSVIWTTDFPGETGILIKSTLFILLNYILLWNSVRFFIIICGFE